MPLLCFVIDQASLLILGTARFTTANHMRFCAAVVETRGTKLHCDTISDPCSK
jgi:hypothetical protein